ncbi:hypothetical protein GH714_021445 [Hevea brasiliensis]|uniref:Uncharacterized protein n=1 Tax=Hevea brasiliensis TaxID=3981 RepID=A0A6A6M5C2_HEVBR|nr:hypothetical protein GH714_021445 [Hevea brasiliensis]
MSGSQTMPPELGIFGIAPMAALPSSLLFGLLGVYKGEAFCYNGLGAIDPLRDGNDSGKDKQASLRCEGIRPSMLWRPRGKWVFGDLNWIGDDSESGEGVV